MANDEMRTLFREELGSAFGGIKGEINTALNVFRGEITPDHPYSHPLE